MSNEDVYKTASKLDDQILIEVAHIMKDDQINHPERTVHDIRRGLLFVRTIKTTVEILEEGLHDDLRLQIKLLGD